MNNDSIRIALADLRTHIATLARRWRLRRVGEDLRRTFAAIDAALQIEPAGSATAFFATLELVELLESRAPSSSLIVDPALDAARALFGLLADGARVPPDVAGELHAAVNAENERQAAGHPPSVDCPICAVLARHGLPAADGAMLGS
jgi:hypothetical protein